MKKAIFFFACLFAVGSILAQTNLSSVKQADKKHVATVDQQGGDNTSNVTQSNEGNDATITQTNLQFKEDATTLSNVYQSGKGNDATVMQNHNQSNVDYPGDGGGLNSYVNQSGDNNIAIQNQGNHSQTGYTMGSIKQSGNSNFASQNQVKYGNEAYIEQAGSGNSAKQAQDVKLLIDEEGSYNFAKAYQSGDNNEVEQVQDGWSNEAYATQTGNGNKAYQTTYGWQSESRVAQGGNKNTSTQDQKGASNFASVIQNGDGGTAIQDQTSDNRRGGAKYDPLNEALIQQWGGSGNYAEQFQYTPGFDIDANIAKAMQNGSNNTAIQTQIGGFNNSTVSQTGVGHTATVTQSQSIVQ